MRKLMVCLVVLGLLIPSVAIAKRYKQRMGQSLYLAHGVWIAQKKGNQKFINYKSGKFLPAGTEIIKVRLVDHFSDDMEGISSTPSKAAFKVKESGQRVVIKFEKAWHPGKNIFDYYDYIFTEKNFDELTTGMTPNEIEGIKSGNIFEGMRKKAVIAAYGYPPEHKTESLEGQEWTFWDTKIKKKEICFSKEGLVTDCLRKNRYIKKSDRLKIDTMCIDGYKFVVARTIEIVQGRDEVGEGIAMSQAFGVENGVAVPMKCDKDQKAEAIN